VRLRAALSGAAAVTRDGTTARDAPTTFRDCT
jgi:hypothetical protein